MKTINREDSIVMPDINYLKSVQKRVAHQFFIDRKSIETLAAKFSLTKANVLYCITELHQEFNVAFSEHTHTGSNYRMRR